MKRIRKGTLGVPDIWDEVKNKVSMTLTPTAIAGLDKLAKEFDFSRSEFVERVGRGEITAIEFSESDRQELQAWAARENKTVSHLVITTVSSAIKTGELS